MWVFDIHIPSPPHTHTRTYSMHTLTHTPSHMHTLTQGSSQDAAVGVVVHKVSEGGVAEGRVAVGDRIIAVNGTTTEAKSYHEVREEGKMLYR